MDNEGTDKFLWTLSINNFLFKLCCRGIFWGGIFGHPLEYIRISFFQNASKSKALWLPILLPLFRISGASLRMQNKNIDLLVISQSFGFSLPWGPRLRLMVQFLCWNGRMLQRKLGKGNYVGWYLNGILIYKDESRANKWKCEAQTPHSPTSPGPFLRLWHSAEHSHSTHP